MLHFTNSFGTYVAKATADEAETFKSLVLSKFEQPEDAKSENDAYVAWRVQDFATRKPRYTATCTFDLKDKRKIVLNFDPKVLEPESA